MTSPDATAPAIPVLGSPGPDPVIIEVTRGDIVESRHVVDAAVVDVDGKTVSAWGEIDRPVYPRSAIKPLQAIPIVETGAADAFHLSQKELAVACASHAGEPIHVETVLAWLERLGLSEQDLECGAHWPRSPETIEALVLSDRALGPAHNNCSGKHTGMLCHAVHLGHATAGYISPDHPVQRRIAALLSDMTGFDLADKTPGVDGCSVPNYAIPLAALARAMARLGNTDTLEPARAEACRRIAAAVWAEPQMVAGEGRANTAMLRACAGTVVAKTGAEGVYMAGIAGRGLGIALKARDGGGRGGEVAILAVLDYLEALDGGAREELSRFLHPDVRNVNDYVVGEIRPAGWSSWSAF